MCVLQVVSDQKTIILQIPLVYLYAILPLMGILMTLHLVIIYYNVFTEQRTAKLQNQTS